MKTIIITPDRIDNRNHQVLSQMLEMCIDNDVWVDASRCETLGARGLELFLSARNSALSAGRTFSAHALSEDFKKDCQSMGLQVDALFTQGETA